MKPDGTESKGKLDSFAGKETDGKRGDPVWPTEEERNALTREAILNLVFARWTPERQEECVPLSEACRRIVSRDVCAVNTLPIVRASAMDGIAVRSADFADGQIPDTSAWELGKDYVRADTGDDFPDEFDAVIRIENAEILEQGVRLAIRPEEVKPGFNVRPSGSLIREGELILPKGHLVTPYRLAMLATGGVKEVWVVKKPLVTFIPTGSELIPAGQTPQRGENIDANSLMLDEMIREWGGEIVCAPIVKDQLEQMEEALLAAVDSSDMVIIGGGSSKGSEDLAIPLLKKHGEVLQHYAASAPGRPMSVSLVNGKLVINMPGPTLAALAVSDWAVRSAISYWLQTDECLEAEIEAVLERELSSPPSMEIYTRVIVTKRDGCYYALPVRRDEPTADGVGRCNGILVTELGKAGYQEGDRVKVRLLV